MTDPIEYELQLPATRTGEKLAKTIGRILKHTYQAKRLRIEHSKDNLLVKAKVDRDHLHAIRGAVRMTLTARGILGELHRDAGTVESDEASSGNCRAPSERAVQAEPLAAANDPFSAA